MATTAPTTVAAEDSTMSNNSPRSPVKQRGVLPSPWAQVVVRGVGELPEKTESSPPDILPSTEGNVAKKAAWNKPISPPPLPSPPGGDHGVVMGAAAWPALSESTRPLFKPTPSSSDSPKSTPEVSGPVSQVSGSTFF